MLLDTNLEQCARRELQDQTGIGDVYLEQLYTFGRVSRDPQDRVVSIAYYALIPSGNMVDGSGSGSVQWFGFDALPALDLDQRQIAMIARQRLVAKLDYSAVAFQLVPGMFTLGDLQEVHEIIRGERLDKRNFRRRMLTLGAIEDTCEVRQDGRRPARLYRVRRPGTAGSLN